MSTDILGYACAAAVTSGGVMGYYKVKSVPSLVSGLIFGTALAYGAYQVSNDSTNYSAQLAISSSLAVLMLYRFYKTGKMVPAGVVCAISLINIAKIGVLIYYNSAVVY